jgi:hypothetical protein
MTPRLIASLALSTLAVGSGCLLESAVGPGAVTSSAPATAPRPNTPTAVPAPAPTTPVIDGDATRAEPAAPTEAAASHAPQAAGEAKAPKRRPRNDDPKLTAQDPPINMTSGAPWQLEPETDAHWQGTLVQRPGPRSISRENPICDAAHNHCLHSNTWFVSTLNEEPISQAVVAFRFENHFYQWSDVMQMGPYGTRYGQFVGYRTAPATARNTRPSAVIVFHRNADNENSHDPRFSNDARASENWHIGRVAEVNAADGTFRFTEGRRFHPLAHARVAVESVAQP